MNPNVIALEIKHLQKRFGDKWVHRDICLTLFEGEILSLLGGSGSGKSLILRCIIGLEAPDAGSILFFGKDILHLTEKEKLGLCNQIGYVFQNGALFDSLTVHQNLSYPLEEHTSFSPSEINHRVQQMLQDINMPEASQLYPAELSGGMQKRAGLARAIILNPKIILFDEPTAGLDPSNTKRLIAYIKTLKKNGITGIFVTHDIPAAFHISDRISVLKDGAIYTTDTVENIKKSNDPIIRSFIQEL